MTTLPAEMRSPNLGYSILRLYQRRTLFSPPADVTSAHLLKYAWEKAKNKSKKHKAEANL